VQAGAPAGARGPNFVPDPPTGPAAESLRAAGARAVPWSLPAVAPACILPGRRGRAQAPEPGLQVAL